MSAAERLWEPIVVSKATLRKGYVYAPITGFAFGYAMSIVMVIALRNPDPLSLVIMPLLFAIASVIVWHAATAVKKEEKPREVGQ